MNYEGLDFDQEELSGAMRSYYEDIVEFITQPAFQALFSEMMTLPPKDRPQYVNDIWLNPAALEARGLEAPDGMLIQTSAFGDRRPTLFVVKKYLPEKYHCAWENVNWTFNNDFAEEDVPNDPENSWRLPLSVSVQNALIANECDLQAIPADLTELSQEIDVADIVKSEMRRTIQASALSKPPGAAQTEL